MSHLDQFQPREVIALPVLAAAGWRLKRYAILADGRALDEAVMTAAGRAVVSRLPEAGCVDDAESNHGVGVQLIHFAEVAVVVPTFYWQWGSVLANAPQMRAPWDAPMEFGDGVSEVVGCVWEMDVVTFEIAAWKSTVLNGVGSPEARIAQYIQSQYLT